MKVILSSLPYIQIALAALLILGVLLQQSTASLGGTFGESDNFSAVKHTRRGFEKILFNGTLIVSVLFALSALLALVLK